MLQFHQLDDKAKIELKHRGMTQLIRQTGINFTKLPDSVALLNGMFEIENVFYTVGHQGISTAFAEGKCSSK